IDLEGNDIEQVYYALTECDADGKPLVMISNTTKGYGFKFSENNVAWHHNVLSKSQYDTAVAEFESNN
ncbi:MAG: hypothetical protein LBK06_08895, partial [Planctomycetaceae bacterium]|nr:hypothetical protein [Planctomycetaceae bacterium]